MRRPRLRPRRGRVTEPTAEPSRSGTPERDSARRAAELAYVTTRLRRPWGTVLQGLTGARDAAPGVGAARVTASVAIYHSSWYSTEFRQPPYRYLQRGEDDSWAVRRVDGDDATGYRPGAVERRFEPGQEDLVLEHIIGLWPRQLTLEREAEDERRRQYGRSREYSRSRYRRRRGPVAPAAGAPRDAATSGDDPDTGDGESDPGT